MSDEKKITEALRRLDTARGDIRTAELLKKNKRSAKRIEEDSR